MGGGGGWRGGEGCVASQLSAQGGVAHARSHHSFFTLPPQVAALAAAGGTPIDPAAPYAELWMGTHPSGPSELAAAPGGTLGAWLEAHPAALGARSAARFGPVLPFLFKVLSVGTALSIQSHPDKALAERLHREKPEVNEWKEREVEIERLPLQARARLVSAPPPPLSTSHARPLLSLSLSFSSFTQWYKDDNHKPEMAIAVGHDFSALCGFEAPAGLAAALEGTPELAGVIGPAATDALVSAAPGAEADPATFKAALKVAFTALMTAPPAVYGPAVEALAKRLEGEGAATVSPSSSPLALKNALALKLNAQYPADVGVLAAYFLNYLTLADGEAIALAANEPHAYVSGNLVECMATSDNVVRAGLTPKPRDTDTLCASLTYTTGKPEVLSGSPLQEHTVAYAPPFDEFEVVRVALPAGADTLLPPSSGPAIILVGSGAGGLAATELSLGQGGAGGLAASAAVGRGEVLFIPAGTPLRVEAGSGGGEEGGAGGLTLWVAQVSSRVLGEPVVVPSVAVPAAAAPATPAVEAAAEAASV